MRTTDDEVLHLVERSRAGDRASFDALVRRYYALAYNLAFRMLSDPDRAADATQSAFVRAYRAMPRFRQEANFSTWLYRIVTNVCLDTLRRPERGEQSLTAAEQEEGPGLEEIDIPDGAADPALTAEQRERQQVVQEALKQLRDDHRAIVVMYDLQGMAYEDIARALRIPLGTVKSRLNRARHALKEALASRRDLFSDLGVSEEEP
jgi:RNA polymerase sigma-70 factor (ECF subfamily)